MEEDTCLGGIVGVVGVIDKAEIDVCHPTHFEIELPTEECEIVVQGIAEVVHSGDLIAALGPIMHVRDVALMHQLARESAALTLACGVGEEPQVGATVFFGREICVQHLGITYAKEFGIGCYFVAGRGFNSLRLDLQYRRKKQQEQKKPLSGDRPCGANAASEGSFCSCCQSLDREK